VKEGPNKGQIEPAIVRKIPLQNISKVSARFVAVGNWLISIFILFIIIRASGLVASASLSVCLSVL